jgi:hypothetical protein
MLVPEEDGFDRCGGEALLAFCELSFWEESTLLGKKGLMLVPEEDGFDGCGGEALLAFWEGSTLLDKRGLMLISQRGGRRP